MASMELYHVCVPPVRQIGHHEHPQCELSLVVKGHGKRIMCDQEMPFAENDLVLVPPDMPHQWIFDDSDSEIESITVLFCTEWLGEICRIIPSGISVADQILKIKDAVQFQGKTSDEVRELMSMMLEQSEFERVISLLRILIMIAGADDTVVVGKKKGEITKRVEKIQTYVDCNYNHSLTIEDIARYVGMNRSALCVFFRKHTGKTIVTAINTRKLEVACNLLRDRNLTVRDVCYMSGFNDYPYFCRVFKRNLGMTPSGYRRNI